MKLRLPGKMKNAIACLIVTLVFIAQVSGQKAKDTGILKNYDFFTSFYDRNYGLFEKKGINWKFLTQKYRSIINEKISKDSLYSVMCTLIAHLNDPHVYLDNGVRRYVSGGGTFNPSNFDLSLIKTKYLKEVKSFFYRKNTDTYMFCTGYLNDSVGYIYIKDFVADPKSAADSIDIILHGFINCAALVIDVRMNTGGNDVVAQYIANRFAAQKRLFMQTKMRYGSRYSDFTKVRPWYIEPEGIKFLKNVYILTNKRTNSGAENFCLAMRVNDQVFLIGDTTTSGAFSDTRSIFLPNGWKTRLSYKVFEDHNGVCYEGKGLTPDLLIKGTKESLEKGVDLLLEKVSNIISKGDKISKPGYMNPKPNRQSFAKLIEQSAGDSIALQEAFKQYEKNQAIFYVNDEEVNNLVDRLIKYRQISVAVKLLTINLKINRNTPTYYKMIYKKLILEGGFAEANKIALYHTEAVFDEVALNENTMNSFGYYLFFGKYFKEAIEVFSTMTRIFPDSGNAFDSLGEAYYNLKEYKAALKAYKEALRINPGNKNAEESIKKITSLL